MADPSADETRSWSVFDADYERHMNRNAQPDALDEHGSVVPGEHAGDVKRPRWVGLGGVFVFVVFGVSVDLQSVDQLGKRAGRAPAPTRLVRGPTRSRQVAPGMAHALSTTLHVKGVTSW
jgi:hypothetical protein